MENKREKILKIALRLFVDNGYHGTPTSKIAKESGVATGTLFHYFKTKEDLINSLYISLKAEKAESIKKAIDDDLPVKENLKIFLFHMVQQFLKNKYSFMFFKQYYASPFVTDKTREEGMKEFSMIIGFFEKATEDGILKDVPENLMMDLVNSLLMGICEHFLSNPKKFKDENYKELVFNLFWDFIKK